MNEEWVLAHIQIHAFMTRQNMRKQPFSVRK